MVVHQVEGAAEFDSHVSSAEVKANGKLVVVEFSASWCGPCRKISPVFDAMSEEYPSVGFVKVMEDSNQALFVEKGVKCFPTFQFFVGGVLKDTVQGADEGLIRKKIEELSKPAFSGTGSSLGGGQTALSPEEARMARLAKLEKSDRKAIPKRDVPVTSPPPESKVEQPPSERKADDEAKVTTEDDADMKMAVALSQQVAQSPDEKLSSSAPAPAPTPAPAPLVDEGDLAMLLEMGFAESHARRALCAPSVNDLESAINWIENNQDQDANTGGEAKSADENNRLPEETKEGASATLPVDDGVMRSYKCNATGKLFRSMAEVEFYAEKTGYEDFSESSTEIKPLTPEEKEAKVVALREKIKRKKRERELKAKEDAKVAERLRRESGKQVSTLKEEHEARERKMVANARRKEKIEMQKEKERIRAQLARDKAERAANKGKLGSNFVGNVGAIKDLPSTNNEDGEATAAPVAKATTTSVDERMAGLSSEERRKAFTDNLSKLAKYRAGGDGETAMKTVKVFVNNIVKNPNEEKYRSINLANPKIKQRVCSLIGGTASLKALGFMKVPGENRLSIELNAIDAELFKFASAELEAFIEKS